eukprot:4095126-Ditylum_brightwellii.AAC.1
MLEGDGCFRKCQISFTTCTIASLQEEGESGLSGAQDAQHHCLFLIMCLAYISTGICSDVDYGLQSISFYHVSPIMYNLLAFCAPQPLCLEEPKVWH